MIVFNGHTYYTLQIYSFSDKYKTTSCRNGFVFFQKSGAKQFQKVVKQVAGIVRAG